jgi:rare lipoprotein A (peptidoglycan hydrolase)
MAHSAGGRAARIRGYRPRHAIRRTKERSNGGLIAAVGLTITGILVLGSALSIRYHPVQRLAVAAPEYPRPHTVKAPPGPVAAPPANDIATCVASWYASSGPVVATAADRQLSPGTNVRITNLANGLSTVVRISGQAPATGRRCLNLSQSAFAAIADLRTGVITVRYESVV